MTDDGGRGGTFNVQHLTFNFQVVAIGALVTLGGFDHRFHGYPRMGMGRWPVFACVLLRALRAICACESHALDFSGAEVLPRGCWG